MRGPLGARTTVVSLWPCGAAACGANGPRQVAWVNPILQCLGTRHYPRRLWSARYLCLGTSACNPGSAPSGPAPGFRFLRARLRPTVGGAPVAGHTNHRRPLESSPRATANKGDSPLPLCREPGARHNVGFYAWGSVPQASRAPDFRPLACPYPQGPESGQTRSK